MELKVVDFAVELENNVEEESLFTSSNIQVQVPLEQVNLERVTPEQGPKSKGL